MKKLSRANAPKSTPHNGSSAAGGGYQSATLIGLVLIIVLGVILLTGRRDPPLRPAPSPDREVIIPADISKSTEATRQSLILSVEDTSSLLAESDVLTLIKFASVATEVFSDQIESTKQFRSILEKNLKESDPNPGSDYVAALRLAAEAADRSKAKKIWVLVVGDAIRDGLMERDPALKKQYRELAQRLASNPKVQEIRFYGVSTDLKLGAREDIYSAFSGPFASKVKILGLQESPW